MILVSACLAGLYSRYDGGDNTDERVVRLIREGRAIPVCPEQIGGMATPRKACERKGERIVNCDGEDMTEQFVRGAEEVVKLAKLVDCRKAILKARSPSCGHGQIYDGTFSKQLISGSGVAAQALSEMGVEIISELHEGDFE